MTTSVEYEVQTYERGEWKIATMSGDKQQALKYRALLLDQFPDSLEVQLLHQSEQK